MINTIGESHTRYISNNGTITKHYPIDNPTVCNDAGSVPALYNNYPNNKNNTNSRDMNNNNNYNKTDNSPSNALIVVLYITMSPTIITVAILFPTHALSATGTEIDQDSFI